MKPINIYLRDKNVNKCFSAAMICAAFSYIYYLVNNLNNYDNVAVNPVGYGTGISSGRWFLSILGDFIEKYWGNYNIPIFNGIIAILFVAISACLLVKIFEVKSVVLCMLLGSITVVFPCVAAGMFFSYTVHYYMLAVLLCVLGAWFAKKGKIINLIIASILLSYSLGIYQAYYPFVASVFILLLVKMTLDGKYTWKEVALSAAKFFSVLLLAYVFYRIFLQLCLMSYNTSLNSYQGINEMGALNISQIPALIIETYKRFLTFPIWDYNSITCTLVLKLSVFGIYIISFISVILFILRKDIPKIIELICLAILFPVSVNAIIIMVPNGEIYTLMVMGVLAVFYLPIIFADNIVIQNCKFTKALLIPTVVILSVCVLNFVWLNNGNYRALYYEDKLLENYYTTLYTQIRSSAGYSQDKTIKFIGRNISDDAFSNSWSDTPFKYGGAQARLNTYSRPDRVKHYLGYDYNEIKVGSEEYMFYKHEIDTMQCYPDDGSIKVVGNDILIRLE